MTLKQVRKLINTDGAPLVTPFITSSCAITQIVIVVQDDGTSWTFRITDYATPDPFTLIPTTDVSAPAVEPTYNIHFEDPVYMDGGVKALTTGTHGDMAIWISMWVNE